MPVDPVERAPSVIYIQYTSPGGLPPLERSAYLFRSRGWRVSFLGVVSEHSTHNLTSSLRESGDVEHFVHRSGGLRALFSYVRFWWRAWSRVRREKPDVVYVSDVLAYPAGLAIALTCSAITIQHEHDTPLGRSALLRVLSVVRRWFIRAADIRVNPQAERLDWMKQQTGQQDIMLVHNCPLVNEFPTDPMAEKEQSGLTLWHHGSLGASRLPFEVVDALALLPKDVTLSFAGYETVRTIGFVDSLMERASKLGVQDRVQYHGEIPSRDDLYELAAKAHVGLSLFVRRFAEPMVGASNKPFDFLGCGLALVVNNTDEWTGFFGDSQTAVFCDPNSPEEIAQSLLELYNDRTKLAAMASAARAKIERDWNYAVQFEPVMERIQELRRAKGL